MEESSEIPRSVNLELDSKGCDPYIHPYFMGIQTIRGSPAKQTRYNLFISRRAVAVFRCPHFHLVRGNMLYDTHRC